MKITIETDGGDVKVSSDAVPAEVAEKAARIGALNAGPAPADLGGSAETGESSADAGPAAQD
jgi:hypothetical protein